MMVECMYANVCRMPSVRIVNSQWNACSVHGCQHKSDCNSTNKNSYRLLYAHPVWCGRRIDGLNGKKCFSVCTCAYSGRRSHLDIVEYRYNTLEWIGHPFRCGFSSWLFPRPHEVCFRFAAMRWKHAAFVRVTATVARQWNEVDLISDNCLVFLTSKL